MMYELRIELARLIAANTRATREKNTKAIEATAAEIEKIEDIIYDR